MPDLSSSQLLEEGYDQHLIRDDIPPALIAAVVERHYPNSPIVRNLLALYMASKGQVCSTVPLGSMGMPLSSDS